MKLRIAKAVIVLFIASALLFIGWCIRSVLIHDYFMADWTATLTAFSSIAALCVICWSANVLLDHSYSGGRHL